MPMFCHIYNKLIYVQEAHILCTKYWGSTYILERKIWVHICFVFSILDRRLDRLPACLRGITDGQQSHYLLVRGYRWPAIFLPGCLASILCMGSLEIRQYVSCCVLSRIPQLLVESAPGLASECSKLCESPELLNYVCRVLCIRASLFRNPLSGQVPQCLPHLHQSACKNPTLY